MELGVTRKDERVVRYLLLSEPDETGTQIQYRCLEDECKGIYVLHDDLPEHAAKEHKAVGDNAFYIAEIEIPFELAVDDPEPANQKIQCKRCDVVMGRYSAEQHALDVHKSEYVFVNLLV